jgi:hypothetical protein
MDARKKFRKQIFADAYILEQDLICPKRASKETLPIAADIIWNDQ